MTTKTREEKKQLFRILVGVLHTTTKKKDVKTVYISRYTRKRKSAKQKEKALLVKVLGKVYRRQTIKDCLEVF